MISPLDATSCRIAVRVTPKGGRDAVEGVTEDAAGRSALKLRVSAPPENGKANKAVAVLLANFFDLPKSSMALLSGETARNKLFSLEASAESARAIVGERLK